MSAKNRGGGAGEVTICTALLLSCSAAIHCSFQYSQQKNIGSYYTYQHLFFEVDSNTLNSYLKYCSLLTILFKRDHNK